MTTRYAGDDKDPALSKAFDKNEDHAEHLYTREQPGLTYAELCEHVLLALFPQSTQLDLLELWNLLDPDQNGYVEDARLLRVLKNVDRPPSPTPSSTRYDPIIPSRYNPRGALGV